MTTTYTIWSRGRQLGDTTLGYVRCIPLHRMGWFHPAANALSLVERATEGQQVAFEYSILREGNKGSDDRPIKEEALHHMPFFADLAAAYAHQEALQLELRGPDGAVIPTEWIDIRDTQIFAQKNEIPGVESDDHPFDEDEAMSEEEEEVLRELQEFMDGLENSYGSEWSPEPEEFPRFQVQVMLLNEADVPEEE